MPAIAIVRPPLPYHIEQQPAITAASTDATKV
jgi:hypothetical protein